MAAIGECRRHRQLKIGKFDQHSNESLDIEKTPVQYLKAKFNLSQQDAHKNLGMVGLPSHAHKVSSLFNSRREERLSLF